MDQVHVVRHKVLVEGRPQRAVARELGLARVTVRKYVERAAPTRKAEAGPRARPVWDVVGARVQVRRTYRMNRPRVVYFLSGAPKSR